MSTDRFHFTLRVTLALIFMLTLTWGDEFDDTILDSMQRLQIRGASVAVKHPDLDDPIIRGYGKTASSDDSPDVTADTAFMLASASKVFVGAAIAVLIDQRVIQLDDDICDVIPPGYNDTACSNPDFPDSVVTWRMLATHRSSLIDNAPDVVDSNGQDVSATYGPTGGYADYAPAAGNPTCPLTDVVGFYRDIMIDKESETLVGRDGLVVEGGEPLNWYDAAQDYLEGGVWNPFEEPGSYNEYSNFAIGYIAALVEHATNQAFQDFCKENIFGPLGMNHTSWFREDLPTDTVVAVPVNIAIGGGGGFEDVGHYCYIDYASGQLYSTANDMALWSEAILKLGVPDLWSLEVTNDIFGCQEQNENGNFLGDQSCDFALTWELLNNAKRDDLVASNFNDEDFYWLAAYRDFDWTNGVMHAGAEEGVQTQIAVLPNAGVYTVVLTNTNENDQFAAQDMSQDLLNAAMMTISGGNDVIASDPPGQDIDSGAEIGVDINGNDQTTESPTQSESSLGTTSENNDNAEADSTTDDIDASESQIQTESPTQGDGETLPTSQENTIHDDEEQEVVNEEDNSNPSEDTTVDVNGEGSSVATTSQSDPESNELSGSLPSPSPTSYNLLSTLVPILLILLTYFE